METCFHVKKLGKNWEKNVHFWGKMETFCIAQETFLMCQVGVGKCMGAIFSNIGSAGNLLGEKMTEIYNFVFCCKIIALLSVILQRLLSAY